jgi:hypothetical protein
VWVGSGSPRSLDEQERPVTGVSQIAEPTVDQRPHCHPCRDVTAQKVVPWPGEDSSHTLLVAPTVNGRMMVEASYGHDRGVDPVVVSVRDHEDAVDVVFAKPRLHHNFDCPNLVSRGRFGVTVRGRWPVHEPYDAAGKDQSDGCRAQPDEPPSLWTPQPGCRIKG